MAWSSLANNQMVSFTDAQTSGFNLQSGQSQVTSNQCMTKNDALTKYVLNSSYMSSYASNQLVPKSAWVSGVVGNAFTFGPNVSSTASGSCSLSTTGYTVYSSDTVLGSNSQLFEDAAMTLPAFQNGVVYGVPYVNSSYGPMRITVNSDYCFISSFIGTCSGAVSLNFGTVDSLSSSGACSDANTGRTIYSNSSTLSVGTQLYIDPYLMFRFIPGDGVQSYYLHSGNNSYRVTSLGVIDLITACPVAPTSGNMTIYNLNPYSNFANVTSVLVNGIAITPSVGSFPIGPNQSMTASYDCNTSSSQQVEVWFNSGGDCPIRLTLGVPINASLCEFTNTTKTFNVDLSSAPNLELILDVEGGSCI